MRPTWTEISLPRLQRNFRSIQQLVGNCAVCAVVKAHAYGHGAAVCAQALEQAGATWFGVTSTEEGIALRDAGISGRILLMTGFWQGEESDVVARSLTPVIWEPWHIHRLAKAVEHAGLHSLSVHLKVDTGMARLGCSPETVGSLLALLRASPRLRLDGICTHLKSAEILDAEDVREQLACFETIRSIVRARGFDPFYCHVANTACLASHPDTWNTMVRPGIGLYGYHLPFVCRKISLPLSFPNVEPVLEWKTRILSLHQVRAHQAIGYDGAYTTPTRARIAVLPVGYADGFSRQMSSRGSVIIGGRYAPVVGNISMDLTLVDVTGVPGVHVDAEVVLIGKSGSSQITAWDHAALENTIPYEVLCRIGPRVRREYISSSALSTGLPSYAHAT